MYSCVHRFVSMYVCLSLCSWYVCMYVCVYVSHYVFMHIDRSLFLSIFFNITSSTSPTHNTYNSLPERLYGSRLAAMNREMKMKELQVLDATRRKFINFTQQQKQTELALLDDEIRRMVAQNSHPLHGDYSVVYALSTP